MFRKSIVVLLVLVLAITFVACRSNTASEIPMDMMTDQLLNPYANIDLSQYSSHGTFGDDGLMWVEISNYSGKQFGYVDRDGTMCIDLKDTVERVDNFYNGIARITYEIGGRCAIIDTMGNVLVEYEECAVTKACELNNGNIYFADIKVNGSMSTGTYMYCKNTNKFVSMPHPAWQSIYRVDYSDGLMLVHTTGGYDPGTRYFDADGNCVIDVDNSNEYYKGIMYAEDFVNGQANVTFVGMDGEWYIVKIDKTGKWVNEPTKISKYDAKTFANTY